MAVGIRKIAILIILVLLFAAPAHANDVFCQGIDDTEAIMAALPDAVLYGECATGNVFIPYGIVSGTATIIPASSFDGGVFWQAAVGAENVTISGLTFSSGGTDYPEAIAVGSQSGINNNFLNLTVLGAWSHGIQIVNGSQCLISGCLIHGPTCFGVSLWGAWQSIVQYCTIYDTGHEGINFLDSNGCLARWNYIYWSQPGISQDFGMSMWGDGPWCNSNEFTGNQVYYSGKSGMAIADAAMLNQLINNTVFYPNQLRLPLSKGGTAGILVYGSSSTRNLIGHCKIFRSWAGMPGVVQADLGTGKARGNKIIGNHIY